MNEDVGNNITVQRYTTFDEISPPICPCASMISLRGETQSEEGVISSYWKEYHSGALITIIDDLKDGLNSPLIKVFVGI